MNELTYILIFTFVSGTLSLIGGLALLWRADFVRKFSIHFVSFAVGALLATAFLDLLPEALEMGDGFESDSLLLAALAGIIGFFVLESLILRFHHYHADDDEIEHHHAAPTLLMVGDTIHNFIDGIVVAAAFLTSIPLGIVAALAVAVHELPQEISDFSVMLHHGWDRGRVLRANIFSSLAAVVGAILAFTARDFIEPYLPVILAFTAGIFIYIAGSNLMPELSPHHKRDNIAHIVVLLILGVTAVWFLGDILHEVLGH